MKKQLAFLISGIFIGVVATYLFIAPSGPAPVTPTTVVRDIVDVPTMSGSVELEIPPGTPYGEVFRLRSKGMPDPHGGLPGDLHVQAIIEVPKRLSTEQEALLRQLAEVEKAHVTPHRKTFLEKIKEHFAPADE